MTAKMNIPPVEEVLPHKGTMILIDGILDYGEDFLKSWVDIKHQNHFKNRNGEIPSWIGLEYIAQTIGAFAGVKARGSGKPVKIGFLIAARKYMINYPMFRSDQKIRIEVKLKYTDNILGAFNCRIEDYNTKTEWVKSLVRVYQPENIEEFLNR